MILLLDSEITQPLFCPKFGVISIAYSDANAISEKICFRPNVSPWASCRL
ncbi:hypothetical protein Scep_026733 [Stephania cephalantha]|uniref:Uncharacterized protein n=1 Tax=Stephania cephalantha TaxID=152367 RepID=A0AAP0HQQ9_9MAGN